MGVPFRVEFGEDKADCLPYALYFVTYLDLIRKKAG